MLKVTNNSSTVQYSVNIDGTQRSLTVNGGFYYYDDAFIAEAEKVTETIPDLKLINFAGPILQRDEIDIVGKGQGLNKTTTGVYGITITEDFGIGDELFIHWTFHPMVKRDVDAAISFGFAPTTSEIGKLVSAEIHILSGNGIGKLDDVPVIYNLTDLPVSEIALESGNISLTIPKEHFAEEFTDLGIKLKRVPATSDDLAGKVALHHVFCDYQRYIV